jgi:hypothetical protein
LAALAHYLSGYLSGAGSENQLSTIAVSVLFAQAGRWERPSHAWHPFSGSIRAADFQYKKQAATDVEPKEAAA